MVIQLFGYLQNTILTNTKKLSRCKTVFLSWGCFCLPLFRWGMFSNMWRHFWRSQVEGCYWLLMERGLHCTGQPSTTNDYLVQMLVRRLRNCVIEHGKHFVALEGVRISLHITVCHCEILNKSYHE